MQRAQQIIDSLVMHAPIDGVVSVKENRDASGGFFFFGMVLPEYRQGDSVWPGRPVADVIESGKMEVRAKVDETDRENLTSGQPAADLRRHAAGPDVQRDGRARCRELAARGELVRDPPASTGSSTSRSSSTSPTRG